MAEGTPIGALAVRIGADSTDLLKGLKEADTALARTAARLGEGVKAAGQFAAAAAAAGTAVFAMVKKVAEGADELGKLSQKVGISVESLSALKHAASLSDVSLDQLSGGLRHLSKFMAENGLAAESVEERLLKISDEFSKSADGAGKTATAMKLFGKSGAELIPLLNQGRAGFEEMRKEAERLGLIISRDAAEAAEKFNDNITRLKGGVEGLTIQLAGPFVRAFGDATTAMIEARDRGESFFRVMSEGMLRLMMGSDAQIIEREIVNAGEALLSAQKKLDQALKVQGSAGMREFGDNLVRQARAEVVMATAELERLRAIKPIMAPESQSGGKKDDKKPQMLLAPDEEALKAAREAYLKAFAMEEEARRLGEEFVANERKRELEEAQKHYELMLELRRQAIEEEARLEAELPQLLDDFRRKERENEDKTQRERMGQTRTFLGAMSGLMNTESKKMFKIGQAAAIAETVINTYAAAMGAYKALAGIPIVGPALGAAAAAAAVATGMSQVQQIRSTQVGGGGGGAVGTFPASPVTGQPAGTPGGDVGRSQTTVIKGINPNDFFTGKQLRSLVESLHENQTDGGKLVFAS